VSQTTTRPLAPTPAAPATAPPEDAETIQQKHPSVPDVRGGGPVAPDAPTYQPPKEHLGLNPANQWTPDPTPTAGGDRSVPDAPVVGGGTREGLPQPGESLQQLARESGGAWPPLAPAEGAKK
jgi:hypothetical protein